MILTRDEILRAIKNGEILIDPFDETSLESASYNVTLHNKIRVFCEGINDIDIQDVAEDVSILNEVTRVIEIPDNGYYLMKPGELVLGMTTELISLSPSIAGWIQGRSRFARMGLMIHVTASFLHPGIKNRQVFEIFNASRNAIKLRAGLKIAQIVFERCAGSALYKGVFSDQKEI
ncbi:MAG: dCTP deaminase [Candidatus Korarchaeota archaeon]